MFNIGSGEVLVILLVGLIVLGPAKLPGAVRQVGRFAGEVRRIGASFRQELRDAVEEPIQQTKATLAAADPRSAIKQAIANPSPSDSAKKPPANSRKPATTADTDAKPATTADTDAKPAATAGPDDRTSSEAGAADGET